MYRRIHRYTYVYVKREGDGEGENSEQQSRQSDSCYAPQRRILGKPDRNYSNKSRTAFLPISPFTSLQFYYQLFSLVRKSKGRRIEIRQSRDNNSTGNPIITWKVLVEFPFKNSFSIYPVVLFLVTLIP